MVKVMVFGTFDGLHDGHRAMLEEARRLGDYLMAVVAQDHMVAHLKGHLPKKNLVERFEHLQKQDGVDKVVIGDAHVGTWNVIKRYKPNVIGIGHDQHMLKSDLENILPRIGVKAEIKQLKYFESNKE